MNLPCLPHLPCCSVAGRHGRRVLCHQCGGDTAFWHGGLALCLPAGALAGREGRSCPCHGIALAHVLAAQFFPSQMASHMPSLSLPFFQVAVISVVTAALVYRYAVDPRHLHHHPSLHGGSLGGLARPGSSMGAGSAGSMGRLDPGSGTAGLSAAADLEGQRPGPRHAAPLTWQQVRRGDAQWGSLKGSVCSSHTVCGALSQLPC